MDIDEILDFLEVDEARIIGSYDDDLIKFPGDIDLAEEVHTSKTPKEIQKLFQRKFVEASKNKNIFILDFKAGMWKANISLRWDKSSMRDGFQWIDDQKITFLAALAQQSTIKMDIAVRMKDDGKVSFQEVSENYYFCFEEDTKSTESCTFKERSEEDIIQEMREDISRLLKKGKFFKALKRLYRISIIEGKPDESLLEIINSDLGLMSQRSSRLKLLHDLIKNKFRKPLKKDIINDVKKIEADSGMKILEGVNPSWDQLKEMIDSAYWKLDEKIEQIAILNYKGLVLKP